MTCKRHFKHPFAAAGWMGVWLVLWLAVCPLQLWAQQRKVQNRPYIDMRRWHYGFLFGLHVQDYEFTNNGLISPPTVEGGTPQQWFADVAAYSPGFSVGVLGELYLTQHCAFRIVPTMHFGDKQVVFREQNSGQKTTQTIKSTYISLPLDLKVSAQRFNNYRPYVMAGVNPMVDLTVKKQKELLVQRLDCALEVGLGCDFYLPFFKLIPELKFCFGLRDMLVKDRSDLIDKNLLIYSQSVDRAAARMIVLTLYFE